MTPGRYCSYDAGQEAFQRLPRLYASGVGQIDLLWAKCIHKLQQVCQPISEAHSKSKQRKLWELDHLLLTATVPGGSFIVTSLYAAACLVRKHRIGSRRVV